MSATDGRLRPRYPLHQMTTSELAEYRESLRVALAMDELPPLYPPRETIRAQLEAVLNEEADRERIRHSP